SGASSVTWMPLSRNGGQTLKMCRRVLGFMKTMLGTERIRRGSASEQEGGHLPAVLADERLVLDHPERIDQALAGQSVLVRAVALEHVEELLQRLFRIAGHQRMHPQQVARAQVVRIGLQGGAQCVRRRRVR